jgi:hypothetical protein
VADYSESANYARDQFAKIYSALGMMEDSPETRLIAAEELRAPTSAGASRRNSFRRSAILSSASTRSLGAVFNQRYDSEAVYAADEDTGFVPLENAVEDYIPQTRPGCRLPHSWLNTCSPQIRLSTQDLAGKGKFTIFTGVAGGPLWKPAAEATSTEIGLAIDCFAIGIGGDFVDQYMDWSDMSGVGENGCLLIRPDRYVAWRCRVCKGDECEAKLKFVFGKILFRSGIQFKD